MTQMPTWQLKLIEKPGICRSNILLLFAFSKQNVQKHFQSKTCNEWC